MKFLALLLLVGFTGMSVFGFAPLLQDTQSTMIRCLASLTTSTPCPTSSHDAFATAYHHTKAFGAFSMAISAGVIVLLLLSLFTLIFIKKFLRLVELQTRAYSSHLEHCITLSFRFQTRWFALLELSPAYIK